MTACLHHLNDGPLACLLAAHPDTPTGHRYEASWAPDGRHDDPGGAP